MRTLDFARQFIRFDKSSPITGIYSFIHRASGMCYVGSSVDIYRRGKDHIAAMKRGEPRPLYRAMRDFGMDAFDFEILEECEPSKLLDRERFYIILLDAASINGFNTLTTPVPLPIGRKHSDATRARIGASNVGKHSGNKHSAESRERMSITRKGRRVSPETRAKISDKNKGRVFSEETRARMSASAKLRPQQDMTKYSDALRGKKQSPEFIEKRIRKLRGQKRTEEQKKRMGRPRKITK